MIPIQRGAEPAKLAVARKSGLAKMAALGRPPTSKEITGYKIVGEELWRAQFRKCCYCETVIHKDYNDVEHYRPKASAQCAPGPVRAYGYWWLAWTWENLLFACPVCNRSEKNDQFPLAANSGSLSDHEAPSGQELPLLIDPASGINPLEHIIFIREAICRGGPKQWYARPRHGSQLGNHSITVFGMNHENLLDLRDSYYELNIAHRIVKLQQALAGGKFNQVSEQYEEALRLLLAGQPYVALAYDALRAAIDDIQLEQIIQRKWPAPSDIPLAKAKVKT